jgi:hypothetical protein
MNRYLPSFVEQRAADFAAIHAARAVAGAGAAEHLKAIGRGELVPHLKAAVDVGLSDGSTWGDELTAYREMMVAFLDSLRSLSLYDSMAASATRLPLQTKISSAATGAVAQRVLEGGVIPASALSLSGGTLLPRKVASILAISAEVMNAVGAEAFLLGELQRSVASGTDVDFLSEVDTIEIEGSSTDETAVLATLRSAVASLRLHAGSRLYLGLSPRGCAVWTLLGQFWPCFADLSPSGGSIQGITTIPSDAVGDNEAVLVDAGGFVVSSDDSVDVAISRGALIDLRDSFPDESEKLLSLFQTESAGLRVIRNFGFAQTREASAVRITGLVLPANPETT